MRLEVAGIMTVETHFAPGLLKTSPYAVTRTVASLACRTADDTRDGGAVAISALLRHVAFAMPILMAADAYAAIHRLRRVMRRFIRGTA